MLQKILILFALLAAISADEQETTLQLGLTKFLIVDNVKLPWEEAVQYCANKSMTLFSPKTAERTEKLSQFLTERGYVDNPNIGNDFIYWTSGKFNKTLGKFVWQSTGEEFTFTSWLPGMPDNWRGDEYCVEMGFREVGKWNDTRCRYRRYFMCEGLIKVQGN